MRDREAIDVDLATMKHPSMGDDLGAVNSRLAGDVGPLLEQFDWTTADRNVERAACDLADAKVAEQAREIERLRDEYAEHMSHASGQIYDLTAERDALRRTIAAESKADFEGLWHRAEAERDALVARLAEVEKERDDAGLRWGEHYNRRLAELEDKRDRAESRRAKVECGSIIANEVLQKIHDAVGAGWNPADGAHSDTWADTNDTFAAVESAVARLAAVRVYVDDPGNWSALDGHRGHLLALLDGDPTP